MLFRSSDASGDIRPTPYGQFRRRTRNQPSRRPSRGGLLACVRRKVLCLHGLYPNCTTGLTELGGLSSSEKTAGRAPQAGKRGPAPARAPGRSLISVGRSSSSLIGAELPLRRSCQRRLGPRGPASSKNPWDRAFLNGFLSKSHSVGTPLARSLPLGDEATPSGHYPARTLHESGSGEPARRRRRARTRSGRASSSGTCASRRDGSRWSRVRRDCAPAARRCSSRRR